MRTLVTGGVRSGKSAYAESLLGNCQRVHYVAPGPVPDPAADPEWAARIATHRLRRPASWTTVETSDLAGALTSADATGAEAVLIDCLGTWVTAVVDELGRWDEPLAHWRTEFDGRLDALVDAWQRCPVPVVAVTNEVGWGVVPAYRSGRTFADLLGTTNATLARHADVVILMVAGRALTL